MWPVINFRSRLEPETKRLKKDTYVSRLEKSESKPSDIASQEGNKG